MRGHQSRAKPSYWCPLLQTRPNSSAPATRRPISQPATRISARQAQPQRNKRGAALKPHKFNGQVPPEITPVGLALAFFARRGSLDFVGQPPIEREHNDGNYPARIRDERSNNPA